jgi:hypothetical protein
MPIPHRAVDRRHRLHAAGGPTIVGKETNAQMLRTAIAQQGVHLPLTYELRFQEVQLLGDRAFEWGSYEGRPWSGGTRWWGRERSCDCSRVTPPELADLPHMFAADRMPAR